MKLCSFVVLIFTSTILLAQNISQSEALSLAQKFMTAKSARSETIKSVSYAEKGLENLYFFTNEENTSFVVIAGNKAVPPVVAYSFESGLDEQLPPPVEAYFLGCEAGIKKAIDKSLAPDAKVSEEWKMLSKSGEQPVYLKSAVTPLLATTWNQDCYYNGMAPLHVNGPCGRCYAGCVATAMGQVMKYHNYPPSGQGSNIYGTGSYSNLSVDFSTATYDWANMPNSINSDHAEIAKLLYHCGVSVNMGYAFDGSGAQSSDAATALVDHFVYAPYAFYVDRDVFTDDNWIWVITNDLKSRRPIYYSGQSTGGGHAFVCDGIDNSNKLHINWGWGGSSNGYFTLNNMLGFDESQAAIFGVEPPTGDIEYCQPSTIYTAASDTITDGSGANKYGNQSNCSWTIQPPGAGLIYIHFTQMALDDGMDNVFVFNGTSTSDPLVTTVTGFDLPQEILVWGPSAYVVFQSDDMLRADGFEFYYVSSPVGIQEAFDNGKITVFPNPADDIMNIQFDPLVLPAIQKIELISMTGSVLFTIENPLQQQSINVGSYAEGLYGLRFTGDQDSYFSFVEIK